MQEGKTKGELILDNLRKRRDMDRIVDVEEEKRKFVVFTLSGDLYAFSGEAVSEILHLPVIYYVPGAPDFIPGVVNIRGDIESVVRINGFLGLAGVEPGPKSRIVIASANTVRSGILVDSVEDVMDIPVSLIIPPISTLSQGIREFVAGEIDCGGKTATLLDIGKIFDRLK